MISYASTWDTTTLDLMADAYEHEPQATDRVLRREVRPFVSRRVDERFRTPPPPAPWSGSNPPPWTSDKQQGAYWQTEGWGAGIPTTRTGRHTGAWQVRANYKKDFGLIVITNTEETSVYVYGEHQQKFHKITGWPYAPEVIPAIFEEAEFVFIDGLLEIMWKDLF